MPAFESARTHFTRAATALFLLGISVSTAHAQTPAEVQQALSAAKEGRVRPVVELRDRFGDALLSHFTTARFDKDVNVRDAALQASGSGPEPFTLNSILFVLPMIEDDNKNIALGAAYRLIEFAQESSNLEKLPSKQIAPSIGVALKKHPTLVDEYPAVLLLLAQLKNDAVARRALNGVLRARNWENLLGADRPDSWGAGNATALLAQLEIGRFTVPQVISILDASPPARIQFLRCLPYIKNKSLIRYAVSLLYDTTFKKAPAYDIPGVKVSWVALDAFRNATHLEIRRVNVNGKPISIEDKVVQYQPADIARLYAYYGLTEK